MSQRANKHFEHKMEEVLKIIYLLVALTFFKSSVIMIEIVQQYCFPQHNLKSVVIVFHESWNTYNGSQFSGYLLFQWMISPTGAFQ